MCIRENDLPSDDSRISTVTPDFWTSKKWFVFNSVRSWMCHNWSVHHYFWSGLFSFTNILEAVKIFLFYYFFFKMVPLDGFYILISRCQDISFTVHASKLMSFSSFLRNQRLLYVIIKYGHCKTPFATRSYAESFAYISLLYFFM